MKMTACKDGKKLEVMAGIFGRDSNNVLKVFIIRCK
jgi:hypothetical protein